MKSPILNPLCALGLMALSSGCALLPGESISPGRPSLRYDRPGYFIWSDDDGWHLRVSGPKGAAHSFTGTVASESVVTDINVQHPNRGNVAVPAPNGVAFTLVAEGGTSEASGFDWKTSSRCHKFDLLIDGKKASRDVRHLGGDGRAPGFFSKPDQYCRR